MLRRLLIGLAATLLIGVLIVFLVVRQIIFGGTPTIHRTANTPAPSTSPCATISTTNGRSAFTINSQASDASYEAQFLVEGKTVPGTVMGVTGDVSGEFLLSLDAHPTIMSMKIVIDLRTLDSGASERDQHVRDDTLETGKYPYVTFTVADAQVLPGSYSEGQKVTFNLKGDLNVHGVTRPTTFTMQGQLAGSTVTGSATTLIHLQDFNMKTPLTTAAVTITVSKDITLLVHFTAQKENCIHST